MTFAVQLFIPAMCGACMMLVVSDVASADDKAASTKPSREYEREMQPNGDRSTTRFENWEFEDHRRSSNYGIPHRTIEEYYKIVGFPKDRTSSFDEGHSVLKMSPGSVKAKLLSHGDFPHWEIWRLQLRRDEISWIASGSFYPLFQPGESQRHTWHIDREVHPPGTDLQWDWSVWGYETFDVKEIPILGARQPSFLIRWTINKRRTGLVSPRIKISQLEKIAPWFYEHIPQYVRERSEWFDQWDSDSIAVYVYLDKLQDRFRSSDEQTPSPRMIEFCGAYSFDGEDKQKRFDTYFDPKDFNRIHVRGIALMDELNLTRPSRECDVLILDPPGNDYRVRFMVPDPPPAAN